MDNGREPLEIHFSGSNNEQTSTERFKLKSKSEIVPDVTKRNTGAKGRKGESSECDGGKGCSRKGFIVVFRGKKCESKAFRRGTVGGRGGQSGLSPDFLSPRGPRPRPIRDR